MRAHPLVSLMWFAAVVVAAAGCGGSEPAPESSTASSSGSSSGVSQKALTDLDACSLLTAGEIEAATGHAPGSGSDPVKSVSGAAPICAWPSKDGAEHQVAQLLISWASARSLDEYREVMAKEGVTSIRQVDGPGRFTVLLEEMNMVQAFGDRFMVQTMVATKDGKDPVAAATALARAAMERLE